MTGIEPLLRQPIAEAIAWALLQFVWQGALIAGVTAAALAILKRGAADVRYVVATIALSLMLTMPVVTALQSWRVSSPAVRPVAAESVRATAHAPVGASAEPSQDVAAAAAAGEVLSPIFEGGALTRNAVEPWLPTLLMAWLTGVSLLTLRLMSGWIWIQRLKTRGAPADEGWQRLAHRLRQRLHIVRGVRLLESALVEVPTVVGWIRPVILLPGSALAGLSPQQLEAILAHELAHIRRHDYLVNLMQTLVETLLFYHPAVWWLSHRIRVERENCCDDLAVSLCGDPYTYARALADLEERRGASGRLVLAASGGSLLQRVRRLVGAPTSHAGRGPGWLAGTAAVVVMAGIVAGALGNDIMRAQQATAGGASAGSSQHSVAPAGSRRATPPGLSAWGRAPQAPSGEPDAGPVLSAAAAVPSVPPIAAAAKDSASAMAAVVAGTAAVAARKVVDAVAPVLRSNQDSVGNFTWSHNGEKLEVNYRGDVEFTDDDSDVKRLSPGGHLKIVDGGRVRGRTVEFRADASGRIERRFWVGMSERPFEPEGRQWLAEALPRFIRQTGLGAAGRVARILKATGPSGVLAEIEKISGSWAKRIYFRELVRQASLDPQSARQLLVQAGREIESDFELASLLIDSAGKLLVDESTRKAYFEAARTIDSDFEMRRVYSSALKRGPVSSPVLADILDASRSIGSDFEQASLLVQIAKLQPLDQTTRGPFFTVLATVSSDFEHRRVLSALAERDHLTPETFDALVDSASALQSDFELATLLVQIVKDHGVDGARRAPFFRAVQSIDSAFERGRVLQALARRPDLSRETVLAIVEAVQGVKSSHEASQVLLAVAASHPITGPARDLYIDAAGKLGDSDQGRVLTALVKNERRK